MGQRGPTPKPNARRVSADKTRVNASVLDAGDTTELTEFVLRRTSRLRAVAARWAASVLASPQASLFTAAEISLVEVGAHILHRWLAEPDRKPAEINEFMRLNDRLLSTHGSRLRAHIELSPASTEPDTDAVDELAALRAVRDRVT